MGGSKPLDFFFFPSPFPCPFGGGFTGFLQQRHRRLGQSNPARWNGGVWYTTLQVEHDTDDIWGRSRVLKVQQGMSVETRNEATEQEGQGGVACGWRQQERIKRGRECIVTI